MFLVRVLGRAGSGRFHGHYARGKWPREHAKTPPFSASSAHQPTLHPSASQHILATYVQGVELGVVISVALTLCLVVYSAAFPHIAMLGRLPGSQNFRSLEMYAGAEAVPGLLLVRVDAPLFFGNVQVRVQWGLRHACLCAENQWKCQGSSSGPCCWQSAGAQLGCLPASAFHDSHSKRSAITSHPTPTPNALPIERQGLHSVGAGAQPSPPGAAGVAAGAAAAALATAGGGGQ